MPVLTAGAMAAKLDLLKKNGGVLPQSGPRPRQPQPKQQGEGTTNERSRAYLTNPPAAGSANAAPAKTPYYIPGPEAPKPARKTTPVPSTSSTSTSEGLPSGNKTGEFALLSGAPDGWNYSVMKFSPANRDHTVDMRTFGQPIKLNRKNPKSMIYADPDPNDVKDSPMVPLRGPDGNPVYHRGEMVMVNAEGQTSISLAKAKAGASAGAKGKGKATDAPAPAKKKAPNKPKTRQVFKASDESRQRKKEEYHPWVLEDSTGQQEWVGTMDDVNENGTYCIFVMHQGSFHLVPLHRFYEFKPKKQITASVRADDAHAKFTSGKRFNMADAFASRNGGKVSEATKRTQAKMEKMEVEDVKPFVKRERDDDDLFGEGKKDMDGDIDEMEYDDEVADDEEGDRHDGMAEDEEEKRTQERLKREYKAANKIGDDANDSDDEAASAFIDALNAEDRGLGRILKKNGEVDDDDDDEEDDGQDYYASRYGVKKEEDEDEDPTLTMPTGVQQQTPVTKPTPPPAAPTKHGGVANPTATATDASGPSTSTPPAKPGGNARTSNPTGPPVDYSPNRAASPLVPSGAAVIAMRATSPAGKKPGQAHSRGASPAGRAVSPLAGPSGRAASPTSPTVSPANVATSKAKSLKRKDSPSDTRPDASAPPPKKKKSDDGSASVSLPTAADFIAFIKSHPEGRVSARELASRFRTKASDQVKNALISLVKTMGVMEKGEDGTQWVSLKTDNA